jgi:hypothetical protein
LPFQKELLAAVTGWFPEGARVMLAADRFYGTAALINWCQEAGWDCRIRLRSNLTPPMLDKHRLYLAQNRRLRRRHIKAVNVKRKFVLKTA